MNLESAEIIAAWRDQDAHEALASSIGESLRLQLPANPAGTFELPVLKSENQPGRFMTLLNDDCNSTMVGPHGC